MTDYYIIVPSRILRLNEQGFTLEMKILLCHIAALAHGAADGWCRAGNTHLAEVLQITEIKVSGWITRLVDSGWIEREIQRSGQKIVQRTLRPTPKYFSLMAGYQLTETLVSSKRKREEVLNGNVNNLLTETLKRKENRNKEEIKGETPIPVDDQFSRPLTPLAELCNIFDCELDSSNGRSYNALTEQERADALKHAKTYKEKYPTKKLLFYLRDRAWKTLDLDKKVAVYVPPKPSQPKKPIKWEI